MQFIRFNSCKKLVNLLGFLAGLSLDVFLRIIFNQKFSRDEVDLDKKQSDSGQSGRGFFHVPMALGLPILDLQQEGWDGFSLSSARALLAGLTMLGLAYFSRPVYFEGKRC